MISASLFLSALLTVAGAPAQDGDFDWPEAIAWRPLFVGVELTEFTLAEPRPLRGHALRVDLDADGLSVVTNDDNGDRPEETDGMRTSTFLRAKECQAAVNGAPFWPVHAEEGQPQNVAGLVVSDGVLVSPIDTKKPALVIRGRRATIESVPVELEGIDQAVGGFWRVLQDGEVPPNDSPAMHPRTAVGLADNGRMMILLVVDGRQAGYSEGVTSVELGKLLKLLGAEEGLNLDGGGTSAMAIEDENKKPLVVNRPINGGIPGLERVAASHLGVRAKPLDPQ